MTDVQAEIAGFVDRVLTNEAWAESGAEVATEVMRILTEAGWRAPSTQDETERLNQQIAKIKAHYQRRCDTLTRVRDRYREALREIQGQHEADPNDPKHCIRCDDCNGVPIVHPCDTHRVASEALVSVSSVEGDKP